MQKIAQHLAIRKIPLGIVPMLSHPQLQTFCVLLGPAAARAAARKVWGGSMCVGGLLIATCSATGGVALCGVGITVCGAL